LGRLRDEYFNEAGEAVILYAETTKSRPGEILLAVRNEDVSQTLWSTTGGFFDIQASEILWPYLSSLARRFDQGWLPRSVTETEEAGMRGMRIPARTACSPYRRRLQEQLAKQHPDALHVLSQLLACAARQAFEAVRPNAIPIPLLLTEVPNRVGRLRGYGNAVVPPLAALFVQAVMEIRP
jgi:hypothetical protein